MIARVAGRVVGLGEQSVQVDVGGLTYEVLVGAYALGSLERLRGTEVTLHTLHVLEGNAAIGSLVPRLIGFLSEIEREFYEEFTSVRGIGMRKALRALVVSPQQVAAAIEAGDTRALTALPEIGKQTASNLVHELRGKLARFVAGAAPGAPPVSAPLTDAQQIALEILVNWGDRRPDAERWIAAAVAGEPGLSEPDAIVKAAYRVKQGAFRREATTGETRSEK